MQRAFIAQSIESGAYRRLAGWRHRVVILIPEEVGIKESNIFRTLADRTIERTHTYNALDAVHTYADWVNDLAKESGTTDEKIEAGIQTPNTDSLFSPQIVQAWLMREAADIELEQARTPTSADGKRPLRQSGAARRTVPLRTARWCPGMRGTP